MEGTEETVDRRGDPSELTTEKLNAEVTGDDQKAGPPVATEAEIRRQAAETAANENTSPTDETVAELVKEATIGRQLVMILAPHAAERGASESATECLQRIIAERDAAIDRHFAVGNQTFEEATAKVRNDSAVQTAFGELARSITIDQAGLALTTGIQVGDGFKAHVDNDNTGRGKAAGNLIREILQAAVR